MQKPVTGVSIRGIALRHLQYQELERPAEGISAAVPGTQIPIELKSTATINIYENSVAEFLFDVLVKPDVRVRPVSVHAVIALAVYAPGLTEGDLQAWLQAVGGFIVYPYIREIVSDVTTRGVYGTLMLDPMPVSQLQMRLPAD